MAHKIAAEMLACDQEHHTLPTTTPTSTTSAFNDINGREGIENPNFISFVGAVIFIPLYPLLTSTLLLVGSVLQYFVCSDGLTVGWWQLAWDTVETSFVYFWLWIVGCISTLLYQHVNDTS